MCSGPRTERTRPEGSPSTRSGGPSCGVAAIAIVCFLFIFGGQIVVGQEQRPGGDKIIRVIVFDFDNQAGAAKQADTARVFRREFQTLPKLRLLDIPAINRALESPALSGREGASHNEKAAFVGASVGADKVLTGTIVRIDGAVKVRVSVVDVATGGVDFSREKTGGGRAGPDVKRLAREVANAMLGIQAEEGDGAPRDGEIAPAHRVGVSAGVLKPGSRISPFLERAALTMLHYFLPLGFFPGAGVEFAAGYARADAGSSVPGNVTLTLAPCTALLAFTFPVSGSRFVPDPVVFAGGGATWLSLSGESAGRDASRNGFDWTLAAGMGLALDAWGPLSIQARVMAYYLYEDITVMYWYCGAMIEYRLQVRD